MNGLVEQAFSRSLSRLEAISEQITDSPADWIEKYFYVPDPKDPITGDKLAPGPLRLASHQKRIINEALSRLPNGKLKYSIVIYSAPKKSGKSALASAVTAYFAHNTPDSHIYCLANDGKQSADRIYEPIYTSYRLHRETKGPFKDIKPRETEVELPNHTTIEAIPCDAAGEAGSQPLLTTWSELWGFNTESKRRLWTELTTPPTLEGYAMRWVESYAGFTGISELLEQLYNTGVKQGTPHPDFMDLLDEDGKPVVFVNEAAGMFCYWDTVPRMVWQSQGYYRREALLHTQSEFLRIHRNQWVSPISAFIQPEHWHSIKKKIGPLSEKFTQVVLGVDGAISNDSAAIVGVTRDPDDPETVAIRFCYIFTPQQGGGTIKIAQTLEPKIRELCTKFNVVCVAYDAYQLEDMAQRFRKEGLAWMYNFSQQTGRAIADKAFYDRILNRRVFWDEDGDNLALRGTLPTLSQHVLQAGTKSDNGKLRLVKLADSTKIDAAVAASMAIERCMTLNITNKEHDENELLKRLTRGQITDAQFTEFLRKGQK